MTDAYTQGVLRSSQPASAAATDAYTQDVADNRRVSGRGAWRNQSVPRDEQRDMIQPVIVSGTPETLPARVVYTLDGNLVSAMPGDLDLPPPEYVTVPYRKGRLPNGLTQRADAMARMMARGLEASNAFRDAYNERQSNPRRVATRAMHVMRHPCFESVRGRYVWEMRKEQAQRIIPMKTYVIGKLVDESQMAEQASARIRALELLGKSVSLFTDVRRVETFTSDDVSKLKEQLFQRLTDVAQRMRMTPSQGDNAVSSLAEPTGYGLPVVAAGPIQPEPITNTKAQFLLSPLGPLSSEDPSGWGAIWGGLPEVENPIPEVLSGTPVHKIPMGILELDPEFL